MPSGIAAMERQGISGRRCVIGFDSLTPPGGSDPPDGGQYVSGLWSAQEMAELCHIYLALRKFLPYLRGRCVLVRSENKSAD